MKRFLCIGAATSAMWLATVFVRNAPAVAAQDMAAGQSKIAQEAIVMGAGPDGKPMPIRITSAVPLGNAPAEHRLQNLAAQADLVFRGTVVNIEYKLSEPEGPDGAQVPYTFVTYAVQDVLLGAVEGERVTLRFIGGLNPLTMRYTVRCGAPQFDLGDEDILFVQGNGESLCPLVEEAEGRLRLIGGQVYTESGRAVQFGPQGEFRLGARHRLPEIETTEVLGREMRFRSGGAGRALDGSSAAAPAEELAAFAKALLQPLAPAGRFESADPQAAIVDSEP